MKGPAERTCADGSQAHAPIATSNGASSDTVGLLGILPNIREYYFHRRGRQRPDSTRDDQTPVVAWRDAPSQEGLGLGLHNASEIARVHGGDANYRVDKRQTQFTFRMLVGDIFAASEAPSATEAVQERMTLAGGSEGRRCDEPLRADKGPRDDSRALSRP